MSPIPQWKFDPALQRWFWIDGHGRRVYQDVQAPRSSEQDPRLFTSGSAAPNPAAFNTTAGQASRPQGSSARPLSDESQSSYTLSGQSGPNTSQRAPADYRLTPETLTRDFAGVSLQPSTGDVNRGPTTQAVQPPPRAPPPGTYRDAQGRMFVDFTDPQNRVRSLLQTGPANQIFTDPDLARHGISSHMHLFGTDGEEELLFKNFRKREKPRIFFTKGKVFRVLWSEPAGESNTDITMLEAGTSVTRFGELVYSKVRRFVVVREADSYCSALPITTYNRRGVSKPGTKKAEHSIIHTGKVPPNPLPEEAPQQRGERPMRPDAIRVNTDIPTEKLDAISRIDYGKVYTIQHNIKVASFGQVHPSSMNALLHQFRSVWMEVESPITVISDRSIASSSTHPVGANSGAALRRGSTSVLTSSSSRPPPATIGSASGGTPDPTKIMIARLMSQGYTAQQAVDRVFRRQQDDATGDNESSDEGESDDAANTRQSSRSRGTGRVPQTPTSTTSSMAPSSRTPQPAAGISQRELQAQTQITTMARNAGQMQQTEVAVARFVSQGYTRGQAYQYIADNVARFTMLNYTPEQAFTNILSQLLQPPPGSRA